MDNTEGSLRGPVETFRSKREMEGKIFYNTSAEAHKALCALGDIVHTLSNK